MPAIPERAPIGDPFTGRVLLAPTGQHLLATDTTDVPAGVQPVHQGMFVVRYGVRYLGKPHLSLVPGLLALDYGDMLTGEEAWHFLLKKSNLHPRADVVGYRNDGADEMLSVKWLDLAIPVEPLVYADASATVPLAHPVALIAPAEALPTLPPRLLEYLPHYGSLAAWQAAQA